MDAEDVRLVRVVPDPGCEWCGAAVSQLGTRTPRKYCQRSHRQRALEARKLGLPMKKDRPPKQAKPPQAALVRAQEDRQAVLFLADAVERTSVDVPQPAPAADDELPPLPPLPEPRAEGGVLPLWEDAEIGDRLAAYGIGPDGEAPDWEKRLEYWEKKKGVPAADSGE
ncbi:hypothetical protein OS965_34620 [Streptomyces sp. H27-G5]|uniref:hypothetical protein n=1 Tax=Streptomyces sp. H27-G5 TaxID=2996698 RepID=UPI0022716440|nr:hypothetical protein [Streptomyces sp. H27-G5]MCY0923214.1 hypothetical protein [Streptomyces sp. H27-G5]